MKYRLFRALRRSLPYFSLAFVSLVSFPTWSYFLRVQTFNSIGRNPVHLIQRKESLVQDRIVELDIVSHIPTDSNLEDLNEHSSVALTRTGEVYLVLHRFRNERPHTMAYLLNSGLELKHILLREDETLFGLTEEGKVFVFDWSVWKKVDWAPLLNRRLKIAGGISGLSLAFLMLANAMNYIEPSIVNFVGPMAVFTSFLSQGHLLLLDVERHQAANGFKELPSINFGREWNLELGDLHRSWSYEEGDDRALYDYEIVPRFVDASPEGTSQPPLVTKPISLHHLLEGITAPPQGRTFQLNCADLVRPIPVSANSY